MELLDKKVIVTGGASGFGLGIVKKFLNNGAKVVIADQNKTLADEQAQKLGSNAFSIETDVSNMNGAFDPVGDPKQIGFVPNKDFIAPCGAIAGGALVKTKAIIFFFTACSA